MKRDAYLDILIRKKGNGLVKVITGIRRCGKSYLLFELFYRHLLESGIPEDHIVRLSLDDRANKAYRDPDALYAFLASSIRDSSPYFILLDEIQLVPQFEEILNSLLRRNNVDVYVTGSNARFLSKDIITEFRGRGDQIRLYPLSFAEFMQAWSGDLESGWQEFLAYGGMPQLLSMGAREDKERYLKDLFELVYMKDILERNRIQNAEDLGDLVDILASSIGGLTNPKKLSDTFKTVKGSSIHPTTIQSYLGYLEDAFLVSPAKRFDVKGKRYLSSPMKYYFADPGLRNARLNFRQFEETHLMENAIYNTLLAKGYSVDVGMVEHVVTTDGKRTQKQLEIDFVCNMGSRRIYIQSALAMPTREKQRQEELSLLKTHDAFKKTIVTKGLPTHYNEEGVLILNLFDFLLKPDSLNY